MYDHVNAFFASADRCLDEFDSWCRRMRPEASADHICYKCGSAEEFEHLRKLFEADSHFIYQAIISERRIATIKFREPLATELGMISVLELSDQKPDGSQESGFDHIEIYPASTGMHMSELASVLAAQGARFSLVERPHHSTYDLKIHGDFKVRIEPEPLLTKIRVEEFR